jgi:hypothetical protein
MIFRLLGWASVLVGVIFGLIALLVLLPFLNTFSGSLLVLAAVFGILAWVFLSIGIQLLRPPRPQLAPDEEAGEAELVAEEGAEGAELVAAALGASRGASPPSADEVEGAEEELDVVFESSFAGFDVAVEEVADGEGATNGGSTSGRQPQLTIDERLAARPAAFKKPYPTPPDGDDTTQ